ncbi:transglutaminase family protein [Terrimonas alba]|uniref:transglutaminase family protein n=1 Tax=Terrimonas alba TaxID=3349636 RepID=UPI0035F4506B
MPVFNIHHITKYEYDRPVKESVNEIRIYPFSGSGQETLHHELHISGQPEIYLIQDYWGNRIGMFNLMPSHKELVIESKLIVRTLGQPDIFLNNQAGLTILKKEIADNLSLLELSKISEIELKEKIHEAVSEFYQEDMPVATIIEKCGNFIFNQFKYIKGITNIETTVAEILDHRSGVCQDFAHVMLEMLRSLGIPSRYVSGYICPNKNGMRGEGATHAWVEAWVPGIGWIGNDPTNNAWVTSHHVKLAVGRNFNDCSPIKGTFKGPARQSLSVYVSVGYEDGHHFEEINKVKLESMPGNDDLPEYIESFAGQQQQ